MIEMIITFIIFKQSTVLKIRISVDSKLIMILLYSLITELIAMNAFEFQVESSIILQNNDMKPELQTQEATSLTTRTFKNKVKDKDHPTNLGI